MTLAVTCTQIQDHRLSCHAPRRSTCTTSFNNLPPSLDSKTLPTFVHPSARRREADPGCRASITDSSHCNERDRNARVCYCLSVHESFKMRPSCWRGRSRWLCRQEETRWSNARFHSNPLCKVVLLGFTGVSPRPTRYQLFRRGSELYRHTSIRSSETTLAKLHRKSSAPRDILETLGSFGDTSAEVGLCIRHDLSLVIVSRPPGIFPNAEGTYSCSPDDHLKANSRATIRQGHARIGAVLHSSRYPVFPVKIKESAPVAIACPFVISRMRTVQAASDHY